MENSILGRQNFAQSALARRMRQGCTGPPPPSLHSYIGWPRNFSFCNFAKVLCFAQFSSNFAKFKIILSKCCVLQNFDKYSNFEFQENFVKHEIKHFAKL